MKRLNGKVAIVTGASQGMGESHARVLAQHGASVVMTDINEADGKRIAAEIGGNVLFMTQDVSDAASWAAVVSAAESNFGKVNVLVNNAGVLGDIAATTDLDEAVFLRVCAINQLGVFLGMKAVLPGMIALGGGLHSKHFIHRRNGGSLWRTKSGLRSKQICSARDDQAGGCRVRRICHQGEFGSSWLYQDANDGSGNRRGGWRCTHANPSAPSGRSFRSVRSCRFSGL